MLNKQVEFIENIIQKCVIIFSYTIHKEILSANTGYIEGEVLFINGYRLSYFEFYSVKENSFECDKYRYHFMDDNNNLIFRYDNAPHYKDIELFPHHKHLPKEVISSSPLMFSELIEEIETCILSKL